MSDVKNRMECPGTAEGQRDLAPLYLAGKLTEKEAEAFEMHYLGCEKCREDVTTGAAMRELYGRPAVAASASASGSSARLAPAGPGSLWPPRLRSPSSASACGSAGVPSSHLARRSSADRALSALVLKIEAGHREGSSSAGRPTRRRRPMRFRFSHPTAAACGIRKSTSRAKNRTRPPPGSRTRRSPWRSRSRRSTRCDEVVASSDPSRLDEVMSRHGLSAPFAWPSSQTLSAPPGPASACDSGVVVEKVAPGLTPAKAGDPARRHPPFVDRRPNPPANPTGFRTAAPSGFAVRRPGDRTSTRRPVRRLSRSLSSREGKTMSTSISQYPWGSKPAPAFSAKWLPRYEEGRNAIE